MNRRLADGLSILLVLGAFGFAAWMYPTLPEQIPTHWNAAGEVDDYTSKPWGVYVLPLIAAGVFVLMKLIPVISPKGFRTDEFLGVLSLFQVVLVAFMAALTVVTLLYANGADIPIPRFIGLSVGVLFLILGNYLGKVRKNFFIGIRTPWTLASDEVWARTHRLGGWLFTFAGLAMIVFAFFDTGFPLTLIVVLVAAFVPVIYSFVLYRRLEGFGPESDGDDPEEDRR
ncbi:MAG: SdpI family protein [Gammaproteobacteria bacterium]